MSRSASMVRRRTRGGAALLAAGTLLLLSACANSPAVISDREDLLAAAGFNLRPANTPERTASMLRLPPNHFVQRVRGSSVTYAYADPRVCNCVYFGDQMAYDRYRREVFQRRLADERQMTAQMNEDASWDYGPWGLGPGWY